jgi:hypothetical protein
MTTQGIELLKQSKKYILYIQYNMSSSRQNDFFEEICPWKPLSQKPYHVSSTGLYMLLLLLLLA